MSNLSFSIDSQSVRIVDGLYCLNDLHKAAGSDKKYQPANFMRLDTTQGICTEIKRSSDMRIGENNRCSDVSIAYKIIKGGLKQGTYVCLELVYAYAMWISPPFYLKVIRTIMALDKPQPVQPEPIPPIFDRTALHIANIIQDDLLFLPPRERCQWFIVVDPVHVRSGGVQVRQVPNTHYPVNVVKLADRFNVLHSYMMSSEILELAKHTRHYAD